MKKHFVIFYLLFCGVFSYAQDTLYFFYGKNAQGFDEKLIEREKTSYYNKQLVYMFQKPLKGGLSDDELAKELGWINLNTFIHNVDSNFSPTLETKKKLSQELAEILRIEELTFEDLEALTLEEIYNSYKNKNTNFYYVRKRDYVLKYKHHDFFIQKHLSKKQKKQLVKLKKYKTLKKYKKLLDKIKKASKIYLIVHKNNQYYFYEMSVLERYTLVTFKT